MEVSQDFQFILPLKNGDLLNSSGNQYYVQSIYSAKEIPDKLLACKRKVHQGDPFYIFEHFDTFFSIIEANADDSDVMLNLMRSFDLLYRTVDNLGNKLAELLGTSELPSTHDRIRYLNLTKMTLYLFVHTVRRIDIEVQKALREQQMNQQKKRGKHADTLEKYPDWEHKRGLFLVQLYNVVQCPLEKLWSPPVAEENFVTLLCDICYRILELVPLRSDNRNIIDTIFQIFGTAIKRYNHAMTFPARILQILRGTEHAALAVANGILLLSEEYGISTVFSILIKDIVDSLTTDSSDTAVSRNFSNFLTEFAGIAPKLMIPHLSKLGDDLRNCESHVLRNCVLQIMGHAIVGEMTGEDLSDELKESRNEFLENFLEHVNDVSAHVRSKVLHILHQLNEQHAIPLKYVIKVLCEAVSRLEDKSSLVRKAALQLIKAFLENNPYSRNLTLKELEEKYAKEVEVMDKLHETLAQEAKDNEKLTEQWDIILPELMPIIEKNLKEFPEMQFDKEEEYESLITKILSLVLEKKYEEAIVLVRKTDFIAGNENLVTMLLHEERVPYFAALFKNYVGLANGFRDSTNEMQQQINTVEFLRDSIEFSNVVTEAMPKILEMLCSKTNTDAIEAMDLFTTGYLFGIGGAEIGMQRMLNLVWSSDKERRAVISNNYRKVLFTTDLAGRAHAIKVVQNLSKFLSNIEYGHYTAMESLMVDWVNGEDIDASIIQVLFERFTLKLEGTTPNESRLALQLLIMASQAKSAIVSANRAIIEDIAVSQRAKKDPRIFTSCLQLLMNSIDTNNNSKYYKRSSMDNKFVQEITSYYLAFFFHKKLQDFEGMTKTLFEYYYKMCQAPDLIATHIIIELIKLFATDWVVTTSEDLSKADAPEMTQTQDIPYSQPLPTPSQPSQQSVAGPAVIPVYLVTRFIYCIGSIAIEEIIFLDMDVYNNMKLREQLTEEKNKNETMNPARRQTMNVSAMEVRKRLSGVAAEPQQEPDDDLVGATAGDNIAEEINHICEDMLLYEQNALLSKIFPVIIEFCKRPGEYRDQSLQKAATLTLARLMTVSSRFCQSNMSFFMNILDKTKIINIKCNNVIGLSDLTFRFPNIIEPWTGHFYAQLHEENTELRLTAVKMISHLILHEMIRVKGQIADLALCIVDVDDEIKNITKQFFKEIANKSNILYNVLPDIISKLSDVNVHLDEDKYHTIMSYILGLIQKDRQIETLVEKLCFRFSVSHEERQWRDTAFCLSLLSYNERSIKKLIDNVQYFKDKVQVDEVYQSFKLIINNTSKLAKPELKAAVTEFETRLNECLDPDAPKPDEGNKNDTRLNPKSKSKRGKQSSARGTSKRGAPARGRQRNDSSSENDSVHNSSDGEASKKRQPLQRRKKNATKAPSSSESEDSSDAPTTSQRRRGRK